MNKMDSIVVCGICGKYIETKNSLIIENTPNSTFNFSDKTIDLKIVECDKCGAIQQYDYNLSDDYDVVYRSIGISIDYREKKKQQLKNFLDKYNLTKENKFLELGCGNGQFLKIFKEIGIDCWGYESGKDNYNECVYDGFNVSNSMFHINSLEEKFDVVFAFHYLEHLPDPEEFIKICYKLLKPNGIGLIEVPHYNFIEKNTTWVEFTKDHLFYFRKRTLSYLLIKCGFEIEEVQENNGGICLTLIVRKPQQVSFDMIKEKMHKDLEKFENYVKEIKGEFCIHGAGHHAQLCLYQIYKKYNIKPKRIFDSNKQKCGGKLCDVEVEYIDKEIYLTSSDNLIIMAGSYNEEVYKQLVNRKIKANIIKWN